MNLRTQLSSGTGTTKFLGRKQITLLMPSTTPNLAESLLIRKYQRNSKNSTEKQLKKTSLICSSNLKLKNR